VEIHTEDIIALLEGKLSPDEQTEFKKILENSPEFQKEFDDIYFIWKTSSELKLHRQADTSRNWNVLSRRMKSHAF
jgi:hypothetical protein